MQGLSTLCLLGALALPVWAAPTPFPDAAATDPVRRGLMRGFPPPADKTVRWADGSHMKFPNTRWSFSHMGEIVPTAVVSRGAGGVAPLPRAERDLDAVRYVDLEGVARTWSEALAATWSDGVIVMHQGRVVSERYFGALDAHRNHIAMSVTKSFVGLLAALLAHEGALDPAAPVTRYLPELAASAWGDATLRQVMDMTVGVRYSENYADPAADVWAYSRAVGALPAGATPPPTLHEFLRGLPKEGAHDEVFGYKSVNTEVLGWIVQRVGGKPLHELLSERIWQPLGAEGDAQWLIAPGGAIVAGGGLNLRLRDLARVGEMMRNRGRYNDRQIVPAAVVDAIAAGGNRTHFARAGYRTLPDWSYRDQWWISAQGDYMARGIHGQAIYVNPAAEVVIARFGSHPLASNTLIDPVILPAYRAIAAHLSANQ